MNRVASMALAMLIASPACASACDLDNPYEIYTKAGIHPPAELQAYCMMAEHSVQEMESLEEEYEQECATEVAVTPLGIFQAYAYCGCRSCTAGTGLTATGTAPVEGRTVAVDPEIIPLGTSLALEYPDGSIREVEAEDTGSAIHGNVLDVYISDHQRALQHGVQEVQVYKES